MKHSMFCILALMLFITQANADNGQIAFAYPITDITVDGDLSDWPTTLTRYPIERELRNNQLPPASDFSASFRVAYDLNKQSVFFAIEITDQSHVVAEKGDKMWVFQDSIGLYIDPNHSIKGSGAHLYTAIGPHRELLSLDGWDPATTQTSWDNAKAKVTRTNNKTIYEWQVNIDSYMQPGKSIGLDFLICDHDEGDQDNTASASCFIWGQGSGKSQASGRVGDLILMKPKHQSGVLQGTTHWKTAHDEPSDKRLPRLVRITSIDNPELWVQTAINEQGQYQTTLPVGEYNITTPYKTFGDIWADLKTIDPSTVVHVTVKPDLTTTAQPLQITTLSPPDLLQNKGLLFDYDSDKEPELNQVIQAYMQHYQVPGASIALVKDSQLVYHKAFGVRNNYTGQPVNDSTLFEAASITKIVFAFAVNRLAERGVIDLDKPLYQYLPFDDIAHDERYKKITARHSLSHQTGFPNWAWQNDDGQLDIKFYPGIKFSYSGEGFEYLGRVISHITGKSLEEVIMEEVQIPMGFSEKTFFSNNETLREVISNGHYSEVTATINIPDQLGVAHSMHTEAKTFSNFMINLIKQNGLSADGYKAMLEPQVEVPPDPEPGATDPGWPSRYGLGFNLMNSPYGLVYGHGGNNGDFICQFEIYKDHDMGFIIFTNSNTGAQFYAKMREYLITGKQETTEPE